LFLGAQGVLALSPKLLPEERMEPDRKAQFASIRESLSTEYKDVDIRYLEAATRPKVSLIFGELCAADAAAAHSMAEVPGVTLAGIPDSADTDSVKDLLVRGLLEPLLHEFVANGVISTELHALISTSANPEYSR
jgi:hypothetical protein